MAPKPPPTAVGRMRTASGAMPENAGDAVAIHVGRLGAGLHLDAIADAAGEARLRLDIGVLDEAGLERAFDHDVGRSERAFRIAAQRRGRRVRILSGPARVQARRIVG